MSMSLEEVNAVNKYQVAQMYMVRKMQQQNKSFEDDVLWSLLFQNLPSTKESFYLAHHFCTGRCSHHARGSLERIYPRCKTVIKCSYFTKFQVTIETVHRADNGHSDNVHGLSKEQLATRDVEIVDIASSARDYWSYVVSSSNTGLSKFTSALAMVHF